MPAIVTITFSPCIDKSTTVPALVPEKKLHCTTPKLEPGGGGINAARAIKKLGGEALAIFPSGGYTGKFFNHLLEIENVPAVIIETCNETRENIIVFDEFSGNQYRFGMPGTTLQEKEWQQCVKAVEETTGTQFIIASGSLPPGVPADVYAQLAKIAKGKNAKFIADTSGEALRLTVNEGAYLLKPNLSELSFLAGEKLVQQKDIQRVATAIIQKGNCEAMVISMGASGAMLVTDTGTQMITPPPVAIKSTVGAGDSMVAGIVFYLYKGATLFEAARYGVACGTAATMNAATGLCKKDDADKLYALINRQANTYYHAPQ